MSTTETTQEQSATDLVVVVVVDEAKWRIGEHRPQTSRKDTTAKTQTHLDAVNRSPEVVLVVHKRPVDNVDELLRRTHSYQTVDIERHRVEHERHEL